MREKIDRRVQLRAGKFGVELRLLDSRGSDSQIGVVSDGLGNRRRQLIVVERGHPVIRHCTGASARSRKLRRRLQRGQRLLFDGSSIGRRLQRTTGQHRRHESDGEQSRSRLQAGKAAP